MNTHRFNQKWVKLVLAPCLLVPFLVGCSSALVGSWKTTSAPEGETFTIKSVEFKDDGTFVSIAKKGDENVRSAGTYEFNGFKLTLKQPGKKPRTYGASYVLGGTLKLNADGKKLTMKKQ